MISVPPTEAAFPAVSYYLGSPSLTMRAGGMTQLAALPHRQCFKGHSNPVQLFLGANLSLVFKTESSFSLSPVFEVAQTISAKAATVEPQPVPHREDDKVTKFTTYFL